MFNIFIKKSKESLIAKKLFLLKAIIWSILGIAYFARVFLSSGAISIYTVIMTIFFLSNALGYLFFYRFIEKKKKVIYIVSLIFLALNTILTISGHLGIIEFISLTLDLAIAYILIRYRKDF